MVVTKDILKDKKVSTKELLGLCYSYLKLEKGRFILAFIFLIFYVGLSVIMPILVGQLTDELQLQNPSLKVLIMIAVGYLLLAIVNNTCHFIGTIILSKAGQNIVYHFRMDIFSSVEKLSQNQFNDMKVGSLVTRVCNYTSTISELFTFTIFKILKDLLIIIGVFIIMFFYSWKLTLILLVVSLILFAVSIVYSKKVHIYYNKERNQLSNINTFLNEALSGMKIVQIFNQENKFQNRFETNNDGYFKTTHKIIGMNAIYRPLVSLIYVCSLALIFYFGITLRLKGGTIVAYYMYVETFFRPIQELADELNHITRAISATERIYNLLQVEPEVVNKENSIEIDKFMGKIEFRNVYFAYKDDDYVLKDVSFVVKPKQTVAFVGATGSGKTTILGLIVRNFEPQSGEILIDDINIKDIKIESLRKAVGQMLQDVFLFSGTLRDNITLFDDSYSDKEIIDACEYVNALDIVKRDEKGLDAPVIASGANLSGGERQLLSFARTILSNPQVMILDEATSNIDTETETKIQDSLEKIKNIGTLLIVAHRLSTIQHSDNIIVLSKGKIIEQGNHQDLLKLKGYYYKLYKLQFDTDN